MIRGAGLYQYPIGAVKIIDISRPLCEETAVFPGDTPFSRIQTMSMARGDSCNVTSFNASAHAGTHVDLPWHYSDDKTVPPLSVFFGDAVVITIDDWSGLLREGVEPGLRILFKTRNSNTPFSKFDNEFFCLSPAAVEFLIENGAVLVGVDAPSVDPLDSKSLENHHQLHKAKITILENLDLSSVADGYYTLCALPLKIPDADATWVRAVLIER